MLLRQGRKGLTYLNTSVQFECNAHMYHPHEHTTLIFQPDVNPHWREGLEFCDTLIKVTKGIEPTITVSLQNPTDHNIVLARGTVIGNVSHIQAVYPASMLEGSHLSPPVMMNHITVEKASCMGPTCDSEPPCSWIKGKHITRALWQMRLDLT